MVAKGRAQFYFIVSGGNHRSGVAGRKSYELAQADARSHAARISHSRKKQQQVNGRSEDDGQPKHKPCKSESAHQVAISDSDMFFAKTGFLDPFIRLAVDLSLEERNLIYDYLTIIPAAFYKTNSRSAFCPVREITLSSLPTNEFMIKWVIMLAQFRRIKLEGREPLKDVSFLRRRKATYKRMNEILDTPDTAIASDDVLCGILGASIGEDRIAGKEAAQKHVEAALFMWRARRERGLPEPRSLWMKLIGCSSLIALGVRNFFTSYSTLVSADCDIMHRLQTIQSWNRDLRSLVKRDSLGHLFISDANSPKSGHNTQYMRTLDQNTKQGSMIRLFLEKMCLETSEYGTRVCLAALFAINTALWNCRDDQWTAIEYINQLTHYLENSEFGKVKGQSQLATLSFLFIIALSGINLQHRDPPGGPTLFDLLDVMQFVELIMLASESSQQLIKDTMMSWLLTTPDKPDEMRMLSDQERRAITNEIMNSWMKKQIHSV